MSNFFDDLPELEGGGSNEYNNGAGWAQLKKDTNSINDNTSLQVTKNISSTIDADNKKSINTNTITTTTSSASASASASSIIPITLKRQDKPLLTPFAFKPRQTNQKPNTVSETPSSSIVSSTTAATAATTTTTTTTKVNKFSSLKQVENDDQNTVNTSNDLKYIHNDNNKSYLNKIIGDISTFDVMDPYDPIKPNDYLKLCEERLAKQRAILLEEEYHQQLIEAQKVREAKEKERADAVEQGDLQKLQELSSVGRGRGGRGRGISNLPAWMTEKKDLESITKHNDDIIKPKEGQFDDPQVGTKRKLLNAIPTTILLLKNLVSIYDVDDTLEDEVKQECSKYGNIISCTIYLVKNHNFPDEERVRIFVEFENQSSSVLAYKEMNGRFFGGRAIDASFYDELKFRNKDLSPL